MPIHWDGLFAPPKRVITPNVTTPTVSDFTKMLDPTQREILTKIFRPTQAEFEQALAPIKDISKLDAPELFRRFAAHFTEDKMQHFGHEGAYPPGERTWFNLNDPANPVEVPNLYKNGWTKEAEAAAEEYLKNNKVAAIGDPERIKALKQFGDRPDLLSTESLAQKSTPMPERTTSMLKQAETSAARARIQELLDSMQTVENSKGLTIEDQGNVLRKAPPEGLRVDPTMEIPKDLTYKDFPVEEGSKALKVNPGQVNPKAVKQAFRAEGEPSGITQRVDMPKTEGPVRGLKDIKKAVEAPRGPAITEITEEAVTKGPSRFATKVPKSVAKMAGTANVVNQATNLGELTAGDVNAVLRKSFPGAGLVKEAAPVVEDAGKLAGLMSKVKSFLPWGTKALAGAGIGLGALDLASRLNPVEAAGEMTPEEQAQSNKRKVADDMTSLGLAGLTFGPGSVVGLGLPALAGWAAQKDANRDFSKVGTGSGLQDAIFNVLTKHAMAGKLK